ncbi:MAG: filamentous hemagglutinin N-terminal domain-containing protein [bacterium]|nr:filamentous hemagglutinin N-terminal domain-containing protein [bacterium]
MPDFPKPPSSRRRRRGSSSRGRPSRDRTRPPAQALVAPAVLSCLLCVALAGEARAQSSIALDDTLPGVTAGDLPGPDYLIDETHGVSVGNNQFHSFERFGLESGETATFDGPATVDRFISRVTGGEVTSIEGVLRTNVEGAEFLMINPSGVVVGEGGAIDVRGDVTLSTADHMTLGGGAGVYSATTPLSSVLSSTPVTAFGFLSDSPAPIRVENTQLETRFGNTAAGLGYDLALIGGDLEIRGTGVAGELTLLYSAGGQITLVSVGGPGGVDVQPGAALGEPGDVSFQPGTARGDVFIGDRAVVSSGGIPPDAAFCLGLGCQIANGSGDIRVLGRNLTLDAGELRAFTVTDRDAGTIGIDLTGDLTMIGRTIDTPSTITSLSGFEENFPGDGFLTFSESFDFPEGNYRFEYESDLSGNITRVTYPGTGRAGDIVIRAANVSLEGVAVLQTESRFGGDAGAIDIDARGGLVRVDATGQPDEEVVSIVSNARDLSGDEQSGNGGPVTIRAEEFRLENGAELFSEVREGGGQGGAITIEVARLRVVDGSRIDSSTRGRGDGGAISITATEDVVIANQTNPAITPGITTISEPEATGNAGEIRITTPSLLLQNGVRIATTARGVGDAGTIDLRAANVELAASEITAEADLGEGGDIYVNGGPVTVDPDGGLSVDTPPGVVPGNVLFLSDSEISTSVSEGAGGGGDLALAATSVVLINSQILARAVGGDGGNIRVEASSLVLDESSDINADSVFGQDGNQDFTSPEAVIRVERPNVPAEIRDATAFLREACAAREGGAVASLVLQRHSGLAPAPAGPLAVATPVPTPGPASASAETPPEPANEVEPDERVVASADAGPVVVRVTCPG